MENTYKTWQYLKELEAILVNSKIIVQNSFIGDTISVHKREYYKKRNGKICYVDYKRKFFPTDWTKIKTYKYLNTYSTNDNDWRPLHTTNIKYVIDPEYILELTSKY